MSHAELRSRYVSDTVSTASPSTLLVLLFDRLVLDLERGEAALAADDRHGASELLMHAQEIVLEFRMSLDTSTWTGGTGLEALYIFVHSELVRANIAGDGAVVRSCRDLVAPLRDAWREAALATAAGS